MSFRFSNVLTNGSRLPRPSHGPCFAGPVDMEEKTFDIDKAYKESLEEVEHLLSSKSVVGEPISFGDTTVIPLLSAGFGFGVGGGSGSAPNNQGSGVGGGTGAGGGVRPIALIIHDKAGVRIERVGGLHGMEAIGQAIAKVVESQTKKES